MPNTYYKRFMAPIDRFYNFIEPVTESGCWLWLGGMKNRYGQFHMNGKSHKANRASWVLHFGVIPTGMYVCHKCDVPLCVNPNHLFLGTPKDNQKDMIGKGRGNPPTGEACHYAKLNEQQVLDIIASGKPQNLLAKEYGVGPMQISRIKRGLRWRHLHESS